MSKETKLTSCPFCGHGDINVTVKGSNGLFDNVRIWCDRCGASVYDMTEGKALKRWNRRVNNEQRAD